MKNTSHPSPCHRLHHRARAELLHRLPHHRRWWQRHRSGRRLRRDRQHRPAGGQRGLDRRQLQCERRLFLPIHRPAAGRRTAPRRPPVGRECGTGLGRQRPRLGAANKRDEPEPRRLGGCGRSAHRERGRAVPRFRSRQWPCVLPVAIAAGRDASRPSPVSMEAA